MAWGELGKAFNKRCFENVLNNIQIDQAIGKTLKFHGAFRLSDDPSIILITPVLMELK